MTASKSLVQRLPIANVMHASQVAIAAGSLMWSRIPQVDVIFEPVVQYERKVDPRLGDSLLKSVSWWRVVCATSVMAVIFEGQK